MTVINIWIWYITLQCRKIEPCPQTESNCPSTFIMYPKITKKNWTIFGSLLLFSAILSSLNYLASRSNQCKVIYKWVIVHTSESCQGFFYGGRRWENPTDTSHLHISIMCKSSEKLLTFFPHELKNSWFNQSCEEKFKVIFNWKSACVQSVQNWAHFSVSGPATVSECWFGIQWQLFSIMQQLS